MPALTVRPALPQDYERIGEIAVAAYLRTLPLLDGYAAMLRDVAGRASHAVVLAALDGEEVVGTVTLAPAGNRYADLATDDEVEVRMLAVDPSAQRRGVGERLLHASADVAREIGSSSLVLSVISDDGPRAPHRLYERLGYRRDPSRDYVGEWEGHPRMWFYELPL